MSRKPTPEVYITREKTDFIKTTDPALETLADLANQTLAITYGYWGAIWRDYLIETNPVQYMVMLSENRLFDRIAEVDLAAQHLYNKTLSENRNPHAVQNAKNLVLERIIRVPKYMK